MVVDIWYYIILWALFHKFDNLDYLNLFQNIFLHAIQYYLHCRILLCTDIKNAKKIKGIKTKERFVRLNRRFPCLPNNKGIQNILISSVIYVEELHLENLVCCSCYCNVLELSNIKSCKIHYQIKKLRVFKL